MQKEHYNPDLRKLFPMSVNDVISSASYTSLRWVTWWCSGNTLASEPLRSVDQTLVPYVGKVVVA